MLAPGTLTVAGFIGLGRSGGPTRAADLALLFVAAPETWDGDARAAASEGAFTARYGIALDRERERFYLHLGPLT